MIIRKAEKSDIPKIAEIYNHEVLNSTATLDIEPWTEEYSEKWFDKHNKENHPLIIAQIENDIAGYTSLSAFREKQAYCSTVELSVYVSHKYRRQGIASALLGEIISIAKNDERTHLIVSVITSGNAASERLHEKFGFTFCGKMHEVGEKFGHYCDIDFYELKI